MGQLLCRGMVGRDGEMRQLTDLLDHHGTAVVLGEAGIGKSRLVREVACVAAAADTTVLVGRAVEGLQPVPYRPLAEAIGPACRRYGLPEAPALAPYRAALGRLIPQWNRPELASSPESAVVLGEGLLRLLSALGSGAGALLVVEDIHWADPESLTVLEHLADHADEGRLTLLLTVRPDPSAGRTLAESLLARRVALPVELTPLPPAEVALMAGDCLGTSLLPPGLGDVLGPAEGVPFLVEELLAAAADAGVLVADGSGWTVRSSGGTRIPQRLSDSIGQRIDALDPPDREVLRVAALFGRHVDPALVAGTLDRSLESVEAGLDRGVSLQLLAADAGGWQFRHALTGKAVLDRCAPSVRTRLARRARDALQIAHPGLPGPWCQVAAGLSLAAGEPHDAARHLLAVGRRALGEGALATASSALDRGRDLLTEESELSQDLDEVRAEVAAAAGDLEGALAAAKRVLRSTADTARRARVHLVLAHAASTAAQWPLAKQHLNLVEGTDAVTQAKVDAVLALVELGAEAPAPAAEAAHRALATADRWDLGEVACQSLEVLGRIARLRDLQSAQELFRRQLGIARAAGLTLWVVRAWHELGTIEMLTTNGIDGLTQARDLAAEAGALATVATLDLQLAASHVMAFDVDAAMEATTRCRELANRWSLPLTLAMAYMFEARAHAVAGSESAMEAAIARAEELHRPEPHVPSAAWAGRALFRLLNEDHDGAIAAQDEAHALDRLSRSEGSGPHWGHSALLRTVRDHGGDAAREELRARLTARLSLNAALLTYADAAAAGRAGDRDAAERLFAEARSRMRGGRGWAAQAHLSERLVAECALQDGWGDPIQWLTDAAIFFRDDGHVLVERACRALLRRAGAPVPGRDRAYPTRLPAVQGITEREADVLALVVQGLTNREIAARLYISVRTVDKHVERLLAKTGATRRSQLRRFST